MKAVIRELCVAILILAVYVAYALVCFMATSAHGQEVRLPRATIIYDGAAPAKAVATPDWQTKGVMRPQSPAPVDRYTAHSPEAKRFVAATLEGPSPGKIHVTIIGNADERARVTNDIRTDPAFDGIRDGLWVQDYDPKDWPVNPELGFRPGKPSIIVQSGKGPNDPKGGRVIYRTQDYSVGARGLAEAIRKGNPDYKPDLDPGPHKPAVPTLPALPDLGSIDPFVAIIVGLVAFFALTPKKAR